VLQESHKSMAMQLYRIACTNSEISFLRWSRSHSGNL